MKHDKFVPFDRQAFDDYLLTIDNQYNAMMYLYHLVFDDMSKIHKIKDYPAISENTSDYIFRKMIEFDRIHHKNVLAGGLWMNSGFSVDNTLPDDLIYYDMSKIVYKGENDLTQIIVDNMSGFKHITFLRRGDYKAYFIKPNSWNRLKPFLKTLRYEKCNHFTRFYVKES